MWIAYYLASLVLGDARGYHSLWTPGLCSPGGHRAKWEDPGSWEWEARAGIDSWVLVFLDLRADVACFLASVSPMVPWGGVFPISPLGAGAVMARMYLGNFREGAPEKLKLTWYIPCDLTRASWPWAHFVEFRWAWERLGDRVGWSEGRGKIHIPTVYRLDDVAIKIDLVWYCHIKGILPKWVTSFGITPFTWTCSWRVGTSGYRAQLILRTNHVSMVYVFLPQRAS